jgi:hypothetical protein
VCLFSLELAVWREGGDAHSTEMLRHLRSMTSSSSFAGSSTFISTSSETESRAGAPSQGGADQTRKEGEVEAPRQSRAPTAKKRRRPKQKAAPILREQMRQRTLRQWYTPPSPYIAPSLPPFLSLSLSRSSLASKASARDKRQRTLYAKPSTRVSRMPAILLVSCPPSLNAASRTEISVAVVSRPVNAAQSAGERIIIRSASEQTTETEGAEDGRAGGRREKALPLTINPAPITSDPRLTVPACVEGERTKW